MNPTVKIKGQSELHTPEYTVFMADVVMVTTNIITFRMADGPREGEAILAPRSIFRDADLVAKGDDEIEIAAWFATREGLR